MYGRGFTLIELMIVVAIVAVLALVAIPAYQDYTMRSRVAEGISLAVAAKLAVAETTLIDGALPATQADTGYVTPAPTSNVASIVITNGGVITISYTLRAGNGTILFVPVLDANGQIYTWDCKTGTLASRYRPATCRP